HPRLREAELRYVDGNLLVGEQVAGLDVLELGYRPDVALAERLHSPVLLALQLQQGAHALLRVLARADERAVVADRPLDDAEEIDAAGEGVGDGLEDVRGGRRAVDVHQRALLGRRRESLDDQVEDRVRAKVLRRHATRNREYLAARDRQLERRGDVVWIQLFAFEIALHQRLVGLDDRIEQLLAVLGGDAGHVGRDL